MTDSSAHTEMRDSDKDRATDAEVAEIEALASKRGVLHWPKLLRVIARMRDAERDRTYIIGRYSIERLAAGETVALENRVNLIAASDLIQQNPYALSPLPPLHHEETK